MFSKRGARPESQMERQSVSFKIEQQIGECYQRIEMRPALLFAVI
jgi:hypothetical protein